MSRTYNAAIIGLGFIGGADQVSGDALGQRVEHLDGTHFHACMRNPRVRLVAGSSRDVGRRERFSWRVAGFEKPGKSSDSMSTPGTFADWREMLASTPIDIACVATYTPVHAEIVTACAKAGIPAIYCEKPLAPTLAEGKQMIDACAESGSLLVINHNRRFNPNFRRLAAMIEAGDLGNITSIAARWGAGRLGNVGTHIFDAIHMVTGSRTVAVSGTLDASARPDCRGEAFADPGGWGLIKLEGGAMVTVDAADYASCPLSIEIFGTGGSVRIRGAEVDVSGANGTIHLLRDSSRSSMDNAMAEIVSYLDAREGGSTVFPYPPEDSLHTLETILAFHASHRRNGSWVELPLTGPDREILLQSG